MPKTKKHEPKADQGHEPIGLWRKPLTEENFKAKQIINKSDHQILDKVLSLTEAASLCSYSQEYLSLLSRKGLIGSQKKGRNWVITREALFDYFEKNVIGGKK